MAGCDIVWNSLTLPEWQDRFRRVRRAPLLQSYDYARAVCPLYGQKARWGLVKIDGAEAGLVQIQEAGAIGLHAVILDRGPAWFEGFGDPAHQEAFFAAFARQFPRRFGRRRRIIPESPESPQIIAALAARGCRRLDRPGYRTFWLDLGPEIEILRDNLDKKWRNALGKAKRSGLAVKADDSGQSLRWLLERYREDRREKRYRGPPPRVVHALGQRFGAAGNCLILRGLLDGRPEAGILVLCHGASATYQLGWASSAGRAAAAHNLLLWQALLMLKERGVRDFDLGGFHDETEGITKFKRGLGGAEITLAGHFI